LFDLIAGSGIGGIVALILGLKRESATNNSDFFLEYPQKIFRGMVFTKLGFWSKYKYKSKNIQALAEELFNDVPLCAYKIDQTLVRLKWPSLFSFIVSFNILI
jgi:patatin-like phospholipase/acyl hydrolase